MFEITPDPLPQRSFLLLILRIVIKLILIIAAISFHASDLSIGIILAIVFISELYTNIAAKLILKGHSRKYIGAFVSAIDGALLVFALYFANALANDFYLFILLSIVLNTAEYGLLSGLVEGIVAGFSYAIFALSVYWSLPLETFAGIFLIRIMFITFLGWITGYIANDLHDKETKLTIALQNDVHEEALNEMKDSFVRDAAETFRTPIAAIKGYTDIMLNGRVGELDARSKEYIENIARNAEKVNRLSDELLHIIQLEDDFITLKKKSIAISDFVSLLKQDITALVKIYHVSVIFHDSSITASMMSTDEYRVKIAIKNIVYYILDIIKKDITVSFEQKDETLCIMIGAQYDKNMPFTLFEKDFDAETFSQKLQFLKVYTSKLIVESAGGKINIKHEEGDNLVFSIYIPIN